jgi:hypothetical protein
LIASSTEEVYKDCLNALESTYSTKASKLIGYLKKTWLVPWKESLVWAWVDQHLHLGNRATSRVEGAHSVLKKYLQVSTGDLKTVHEKISLLLSDRHAKYIDKVFYDKTTIQHMARDLFYACLISRISHYALGLIWQQ